MTGGQKRDGDKIRMDLLPFEALESVAEVLTYGAKKYTDNGWQTVENGERRYLAALLRHLAARERREARRGKVKRNNVRGSCVGRGYETRC